MRKAAALLALLLCALAIAPAPAADNGFAHVRASLALIGYPVDDKKLLIAFGTGFCVSSSASKSFFVTNNHVVTDGLGNLAPNLFAILPKNPEMRYKATVVRHNPDPDLAVVSIDAPCEATVKVSPTVPDAGDDVAIAGFPYTEVCELAGLCSTDLLVKNGHKGKLIPVLSRGTVNEAQEGTYSIIYDALADHGNSGGPLFDFRTGSVYGVVVDALPGYTDEGAPPQREFNRAIAMGVGVPFINAAPVTVAMDAAAGGQRGFMSSAPNRYTAAALGPASCRVAWRDLDRGYGEWAQAHGKIASFAEFLAKPERDSSKPQLKALAGQLAQHESAVLATMRASLEGLEKSKATTIVRPASDLVAAVEAATADDAALAASLGSNAKAADENVNGRLRRAAQAMDSVTACI